MILAVGAGEERAVVRKGQMVVRNMMSCTLAVDHRVVDGAMGAQYLQTLRATSSSLPPCWPRSGIANGRYAHTVIPSAARDLSCGLKGPSLRSG